MDSYQNAGMTRNPETQSSKSLEERAIIYVKHDNIQDRLRTIRERSRQVASSELIDVLDSAFALQEICFQGVVPSDQYIRLPRINYNMSERNPHLSNQRPDLGPVNVRTFRITPYQENIDSIFKAQYVGSVERAFPTRKPL